MVVWAIHGRNIQGDYVNYLSPQVSLVAAGFLGQFRALACAGKPDLSLCKKINI